MNLETIERPKTADEARQIAIDWQNSLADGAEYWSELAEAGDYFRELAEKFPELEEEFKENGVI